MARRRSRFAVNPGLPGWAQRGHALRRSRLRGLPAVVAVIVLFAGAAWLAARLDPLPPPFTGTAHASDGDSIRIGGDRIRLLDIDAPERDQICWDADGAEWTCGRAALDHMASLLARGQTMCEPEGRDQYDRALARCAIAGRDLGAAMVEAGLALATDGYAAEERAARAARRGLWQGRFVEPRTWRDQGPSDDPGPSVFEAIWTWFRELTGATSLR